MTGRRRSPIRTLFKVEPLDMNCVIIIKAGSAMDTPKNKEKLAKEIVARGLKGIVILTLADLNDFVTISEQQMNKMGWMKIPLQVAEVKHEEKPV